MSEYSLICGDAVQVMRGLPAGSVQTCVTSPPYYGLRDYGTATWDGGNPECQHKVGNQVQDTKAPGAIQSGMRPGADASHCKRCGARRIDNQIGLESSPSEYVAKLVEVFREVRRVLHPTGTVWLNLGDSYNGSGGSTTTTNFGKQYDGVSGSFTCQPRNVNGLGPKQLLGMPWRVAFALQADGWILRSEIIWAKKSPMPESVTDRPTKAHEQVFLLAKNERYFYDADAIAEPATTGTDLGILRTRQQNLDRNDYTRRQEAIDAGIDSRNGNPSGTRNKRSVWTLGPESFAGAHFATFPTKLVEPMILAGTSAYGACSKCLAPWARVVERGSGKYTDRNDRSYDPPGQGPHSRQKINPDNRHEWGYYAEPTETLGWAATCTCNADVVPCTVLDPFAGSGTTLAVALKFGRRAIGIDLNADYLELAHRRIQQSQPLLFALEAQ